MKSRLLVLAGIAIACLPVDLASAQGVRRHLRCEVVPTLEPEGTFSLKLSTNVIVSNNWSGTIPRGTKFTYTVGGKTRSYISSAALAPGASVTVGGAGRATSCSVTIPG